MDLNSFTHMLNSSATDGRINHLQILPLILEAVLPGYGSISRILSQFLGFDICYIVSFAAILIALSKAWGYILRTIPPLVLDYITASVCVKGVDDLYSAVNQWMKDNRPNCAAKDLIASTSCDRDQYLETIAEETGELFNFAKWAAKLKPQFEPKRQSKLFFHKRRVFIIESEETTSDDGWGSDRSICIRTLGWSPGPIKSLLCDIKSWHCKCHSERTEIMMPAEGSRAEGGASWATHATRPARQLDTVILDSKQKQALIRDVNCYLSPASREWYETRGIPLRRGYLFHGPPGTGKSSLSFCLASIFGLSIYVISMMESYVTEENLLSLFAKLPTRCIVLLEDIDEAGIVRRDLGDGGLRKKKVTRPTLRKTNIDFVNERTDGNELDSMGTDSTPALRRRSSCGITLSGLLNVIDGVASQEGRILIMTSNAPEKLDPALLRPGRVDMKMHFTLATRDQLKEMFMKMYAPTRLSKQRITHGQRIRAKVAADVNESVKQLTEEELLPLAERFADLIPSQTFSPAEIQNFLIVRKDSPHMALEEVEFWRNEELELKGKKDRITGRGIDESHREPPTAKEKSIEGKHNDDSMIEMCSVGANRAQEGESEANACTAANEA